MTLSFPYLDYRAKMARAKWSIGTRAHTRLFVVHYNGPSVKAFGNEAGEIAQLQFDATYHMRRNALGAASGGDGIQYHGATLSTAKNLQLRDWNAKLWHCGNYAGNEEGIAWHLPLGGTQRAKAIQLQMLFGVVIPAFMRAYSIQYINVKGHKELKPTDCPGTLQPEINKWRDDHARPVMWYKALVNCKVRQTKEVKADDSNVAGIIAKDTVFAAQALVNGVPHLGISEYVHTADHLGFILNHPSMLLRL